MIRRLLVNGADESHLNRVVGFTRMQDGTREDYRLLERYESAITCGTCRSEFSPRSRSSSIRTADIR